ncbi:aldehyde dehydrogenase family protein [Paremcibacter congregatus]|uniref:Aldehyde dehydrogenase family protein n=1 Tax=Paremcibacter congregatus TaxID=2043170 RepID=A0A2G4YMB9_9PROT|nr:aldehyde dehydrogenase family protein [Paremcibacter congregatus]PHZ83443.1 aldehyde dehydrogenase family protein [Paremcibacter congregatus]QDE28089.1 aldehyde dehydrogenase family protein [Paremcibacter congregatus]
MTKYDNYINGEWVAGEHYVANINPSDINDVIGEYASANVVQVEQAIEAAGAALDTWAFSTPQERFNVLDFIATEIFANANALGELLSREEGKTLPEGKGEAMRAGQIFKFFAGEALRAGGEIMPSVRPGVEVEITREPVGVVGMITPWNFPIAIPAWKIAPALAYGNTVVIKPAELVPGSVWSLFEIMSRAGLPAGVVNLVMGPGRVVGEVITTSDKVSAVSFTGSVGTGHHIREVVTGRGAKVQLEMGGKNPLVVLDDADLDVAVNCAVQGAFYSTGQRCTASSRLIVTEGIHDEFVARLTAEVEALTVGHALHEGTQIGPVVNETQLQQDLDYVDIAVKEGGTLACGGSRLDLDDKGFYMAPALIANTTPDMRINREEVFGPVASVIKVRNYEEALQVANDTEFGLSAGICTTSLKYSSHFKRRSEAGMVMINLPTAGVDYHVPFGGRKGSSYGSREQGSYAREFYTIVKTAYILPL